MKNKKKQKIPKFDGRPMLWWVDDPVYSGPEIRYGSGKCHKHEVYFPDGERWYISEGEFTPSDCVECGDIFLGYL